MKRMQKGFTLIELMIVVAIIGILAAVAIPQYQDYTIKAKLSKVQSTMAPLKTALALFFQENGGFPSVANNWTSLGIDSAGPTMPNELSALAVAANTGAITATLNNVKATEIDTTTLTLTPSTVSGQTAMTWSPTCTSTNAVLKKYFGC